MTDEEIEELAEDICNDLDTTVYNSEGGLIDVYDNMEIACRAGIKAGEKWGIEHAIEWHDLRKNPDDLPKEKGEYRVYFYDSELKENRNVNWYYYGKSWGCHLCHLDVIAWCELPQYKDKE